MIYKYVQQVEDDDADCAMVLLFILQLSSHFFPFNLFNFAYNLFDEMLLGWGHSFILQDSIEASTCDFCLLLNCSCYQRVDMEVTMGGAHGSHDVKSFSLEVLITLNEGAKNISLLSVLVGLLDSGAFLKRRFAGLISAEIQCSEVSYDLTNSTCWGYQCDIIFHDRSCLYIMYI
ncbi:hypothetical protein RIF29_33998 [Crotalaria pallida]|uniref:Uncharacterized protein n=1 Tax=Crotalaria pallida TaxID=3830 RepID=A0AAN9HUE6_CROPI